MEHKYNTKLLPALAVFMKFKHSLVELRENWDPEVWSMAAFSEFYQEAVTEGKYICYCTKSHCSDHKGSITHTHTHTHTHKQLGLSSFSLVDDIGSLPLCVCDDKNAIALTSVRTSDWKQKWCNTAQEESKRWTEPGNTKCGKEERGEEKETDIMKTELMTRPRCNKTQLLTAWVYKQITFTLLYLFFCKATLSIVKSAI